MTVKIDRQAWKEAVDALKRCAACGDALSPSEAKEYPEDAVEVFCRKCLSGERASETPTMDDLLEAIDDVLCPITSEPPEGPQGMMLPEQDQAIPESKGAAVIVIERVAWLAEHGEDAIANQKDLIVTACSWLGSDRESGDRWDYNLGVTHFLRACYRGLTCLTYAWTAYGDMRHGMETQSVAYTLEKAQEVSRWVTDWAILWEPEMSKRARDFAASGAEIRSEMEKIDIAG